MNFSQNQPNAKGEANCPAPEIAADLKAYADNELPLLRRRTVTTHLRRCSACRAEITAMTNIAREMKIADAGSAAPLTPEMRQRLLERMGAEAPSVPTARTLPLWRRKPVLVFGGGAAFAAAFAVVFVPTLARMRSQQNGELTAAQQVGLAVGQYTQDYSETFPLVKSVSVPEARKSGPQVEGRVTYSVSPDKSPTADQFYKGIGGRHTLHKPSLSGPVDTGRLLTIPAVPSELATERQVHREGSVTVAVDKLEAASDKVEQTVKASGGFVASNNLATDSDGYKSADLAVRVPVAQFDDMLKQFAALGTVTAKSISGEDITERMSDATQAEQVLNDAAETATRRLKTNTRSEKETRYREADLRRVRIELAQTQARLGLLRKMARLSTINVSLTEKAKRAAQTPAPGGFLGDLSETNRSASAAFASAIRVPVVLIIWVLAFSPLWLPLALLYRYASRRSGQASAEV